jgi:hypothetical protein
VVYSLQCAAITMRSFRWLIVFSSFALACSTPSSETKDDDLWARQSSQWPATAGTTRISVCWETAGYREGKELTKTSVLGSWSSAASIDFVGWNDCDANGADIRVRIADEQARVQDFGTRIRGMPGGMTLNFTFQRWSLTCQNMWQTCVIGYAIHEFGHALGFLHEQDRGDMPFGACDRRTDTPVRSGIVLGPYDPASIMNYCNPEYFTRPHLSDLDIEGVRRVYGARGPVIAADRCAFSTGFQGALCASGLGDTDSNVLLVCSGNRTVASSVCANGCRVNPPGQPDECNPTGNAIDPCARSNGFNGAICATGLGEANNSALVTCSQNRTLASTTCANGCKTNPPGVPDECIPENVCAHAFGFNGATCATGLGGTDLSLLYECQNGQTRSATVCVNGCKTNPPGVSDECNARNTCGASNNFNGTLCASELGEPNVPVLYRCEGNRTLASFTCVQGCRTNPPGQNDLCN